MRAAAAALVLIIGAVVILIFANTLNSWVLGGLIGGLAALLISIPISLFLFTILARRHDEELQALQQELEEMALAGELEYEYADVYEADAYLLPDEEELYDKPGSRKLPDTRGLPAAGQSYASHQRSGNKGYRQPPQARGRGTPVYQHPHDRRQLTSSVHEVNAKRSRFQTAALRAARREAEQEFDDVEVVPTNSPYKRVSPARPSQPLTEQPTRSGQPRPTRQLPPQQQTGTRRSMPPGEAYSDRTPRTDALSLRPGEPQTDRLRDPYLRTDPVRLPPQTGQILRTPQLGEQLRDPDVITGSLKNPLVRRAPYMYEDDPLREELAQQIDGPIVRRSSRYLHFEQDEEQ